MGSSDMTHPPDRLSVPSLRGGHIRLTHFPGDGRRPVILAQGLSADAITYALPTLPAPLAFVLQDRGYDVWLMDYRTSPACFQTGRRFTITDIAEGDWPAAVGHVTRQTGQPVQILAHCVSALSLMMGLLAGAVMREQIRSVICSAVAAHPVASPMNRLKQASGLVDALLALGVENLPATFDPTSPLERLVHRLLWLYPNRAESCAAPVCRRLRFFYHQVVCHEQLDPATHRAFAYLWGPAHLPALRQVAQLIRAGQVPGVQDPGWQERVNLPITLMGGRLNNLFLPESLTRTQAWLLASGNDRALYRRREFADYASMDCFLGAAAHKDIFEWIADELDRGHDAGRG